MSNAAGAFPTGSFGTVPANLLDDPFTYDSNLPYFAVASVPAASIPETNFPPNTEAYIAAGPTRFWQADVTLGGGETLDWIDVWGRSNSNVGEDVRHQGLTFSFYSGAGATGTLLGTSLTFDPSDQILGVDGSAYGRFDVSNVLNASDRGMVGSFRIDHADFTTGPLFLSLQEIRAATGVPVFPVPVLEIDRDTGDVTIVNGNTAQNLIGYSITSGAGTLNPATWDSITNGTNNGSLDTDPWTKLSAGITNGIDLSEVELPGPVTAGVALAANATIDLGPIWQKHSSEDLSALLYFSDGSTAVAPGLFEGNSGLPFPLGDLDFNNTVNLLDWAEFRSGFGGVFSSETGGQTYAKGDLDGDLDVDLDDFQAFELAYNAANPLQSLAAALQVVPEPGTGLLAIFGSMVALLRRNRTSSQSKNEHVTIQCDNIRCREKRSMKHAALVLLTVALAFFTTTASVYAQTFSIVTPPANPATDVSETSAFNSGARAEKLFDGSVTVANIDVTDLGNNVGPDPVGGEVFAALDQGPTGVFIDNNTSITTNWIAYAQRAFPVDYAGKIDFWFSDTDFGGVVPTTTPDAVVDNLLDGRDPTVFNSFQLSSTVSGRYAALKIYAAPDAILFPGGREFRFLQGPDQYTLEVNTGTGEMTIKNSGSLAQALSINGYEIASDGGSLTSTGWTGLAGQAGFPAASAPNAGDGWEQGASSGSNGDLLAEAYLLGGSTVGTGASLSLGTGYDTGVNAQDLTFSYSLDNGVQMIGAVEYLAPPSADFNSSGSIDGVDFLLWQRGGSPNPLSASDLALWQSQYGTGALLAASSAAAVPEPSALALAMFGLSVFHLRRRFSSVKSSSKVEQKLFNRVEQEVSAVTSKMPSKTIAIFSAVIIVALAMAQSATASTPDRLYRLGDNTAPDAIENGASNLGLTVGTGSGGFTLDGAGVTGVPATFTSLAPVGTPTYVDVGPGGTDRPGTTGVSVGIDFDGVGEYVWSADGFGNPNDGGSAYAGTINYANLVNHYMQGWVRPTSPGTPGQRQTIIRDTDQFRIFIETDQGGNHFWGHHSSRNANLSSEPVAFNQWTHVAQLHSVGNGTNGVLYVNGVAVEIVDGYFDPNGFGPEGNNAGALAISLGADVTGATPTPSNFFTGQLDDFDIRVSGNNLDDNPPVPNGIDAGGFDLEVDNAYVAGLIADGTLVAGDVNGDGDVNGNGLGDPNFDDVAFFVDHYLDQRIIEERFVVGDLQSRTLLGDLNYSGTTNLFDWFILLENHEDTALAASLDLGALLSGAAVPEPSSFLLLCIASVGGIVRRRSRC